MYQWIPFRLQRKSPKFPVVTENDLRYMLQCIKRTTNWTNSRAQISSDGHDRMGRKIQLPPPPKKKIPRVSNKIRKNPWTKKWQHVVLYSQIYTPGIRRHYHETSDCFGYQKNPYLSQASPPPSPDKEKCATCLPQKIPRSKISNQSRFLVHPRLLKSGVPPPSGTEIHPPEYNIVCYTTCFIFTYFLSSPYSSSVSSCSLNCAQ